MSLQTLSPPVAARLLWQAFLRTSGGPGSGNFGHGGRPGEVGGSSSEGSANGVPRDGEVSRVGLEKRFPSAGQTVDGRAVPGGPVPNTGSIEADMGSDYETLDGVREVPMSEMDPAYTPAPYSVGESERLDALTEQIRESNTVTPLIVVVDKEAHPYILEGGHRYDALKRLGAKSFPAIVVVDTSSVRLKTAGGAGSGNFGHGGRPGEVGGSSSEGSGGADPFASTPEKRIGKVERRCESVARELGVSPDIIHVVDKDPTSFQVGDKQFTEGGHFDPTTGQIEINARLLGDDPLMSNTQGLAAHEISHAIYHEARQMQDAEHAELRDMPTEEFNRLFKMDGTSRPETAEEVATRFPASTAFSKTWGDSYVSSSDYSQAMQKENGHSTYAKAYWASDLLKGHLGLERAVNETLAEVTRFLTKPTSWHETGQPAPKSRWVKLAKDLIAVHQTRSKP